jgi:ubiquinone/menaquinone biosynthesis C-methylase UbiE
VTVWTAIGHQLRCPSGATGWVAGQFMRFVNAQPNALTIALLDLQPADDVLELGCGPGHGLRLMAARAPRATIHGIDQSSVMLAQARARNRETMRTGQVRLYQSTFETLPFPSRSMDKISAVNVAYFWHDAAAVLNEMHRVLRSGGRLAIYVTDASSMRRWKFAGPETHLLFDYGGLVAMLKQSPFSYQSIRVTKVQIFGSVAGLIAVVEPANPSISGA